MFKNINVASRELSTFLILWITQSFSALGSAMTSFALVIWSYQQQGSALTTSLLTICSYTPYVLFSIFSGALSDRWNKKLTILISDSFAALCSVVVFFFLTTGRLQIWHLYFLNALNGLMNTVQQPSSDVVISLLVPEKYYQKVSGMRSFSNSLVSILTPVIAAALLSITSLQIVILFDLLTFATAFTALLCFVKIPSPSQDNVEKETIIQSARSGLHYLKNNRGILDLILFLAVINFTASIYNAALPAMVLSRSPGNGELALGMVNTFTGLAALLGSILVTILPTPKSRARIICNSLLFSMSTENFILAFGRSTPVWCLGAVLGWIFIPVMNANLDVLFRSRIPISMQGRVYSVRNTLQFFTIPLGYFCGGILVDKVFEPFMATQLSGSQLVILFGSGKGSGAALLFFIIGIIGALSCLPFRADKHIYALEE
ncbi:MFS transporter [Anaeromicropila populeti]|uniref:Major Facilitator Superfamily protein n=1 Tax=Anaeromicropila populeti TaxID=37658 RepID=A0A1I6IT78_9FIRM|nr:MFS transporter [Anaeromicropila populeti]SFR69851.1 Major Facilitator Superfamily protein [Anaeromicropila populeti]